MPDLFKFTDKDLSPVCKERSFEIQNEDTLAQFVAELILAFSLCKEIDAHRSIATHYFKERGSIPYG